VQRIAMNLDQAPAPGMMQAALADTLGDRQLRIAYWLEASGRYVDAYGKPIDPPISSDGRTMTRLLNGDRTIALISHATGALGNSAQLGPAVRLGLDNESLRAATLGQLEELRASRARLVEAGDTARRRLERDLHDGAQQQLISLTYGIGLARTSATADGDIRTADLLTEASQEAQAAIEALRSVAHGLYPAVLTEGGLVPALLTLAETSALPLEVDGPDRRFPAGVEAAAYFAVAGAVDEASTRGATYLTVGVRQERGLLVVAIADDAAAGTVSTAVVDRVGALGGRVRIGDGGSIVEIPCA